MPHFTLYYIGELATVHASAEGSMAIIRQMLSVRVVVLLFVLLFVLVGTGSGSACRG